jgi:hypothetical protein
MGSRTSDGSPPGPDAWIPTIPDGSLWEPNEADAPPLACIPVDGGARNVVVELKMVREPLQKGLPCRSWQLILSIPAIAFQRELCNSGCGPFLFDSHASKEHATFACQTDLQNEVGELRILPEGLTLEVGEAADYYTNVRDAGDKPRYGRPPKRSPLALPCGALVSFKAAGRKEWDPLESTSPIKR